MPIEFRCSNCNRLLRTGDETAGLQAECPECGALTTVPEASPEMQPPRDFGKASAGWRAVGDRPLVEDDRLAMIRVAGPANGLLFLAGFIFVLQALALASYLLQMQPVAMQQPVPVGFRWMLEPQVAVLSHLFGMAMSALVFIGAYRMKRLRSHRLAEVAAVVAMIPCISPCCLLGLPFGIWAILVLEDPSVKAAFRS